MTLRDTLQRASAHIARRDAETLALHLLERDRPWLLAHPEVEIPAVLDDFFWSLVKRRAAHEPLQYLTGHQEFFGLDLRVTPDVLIPRPETELLVEEVLRWARTEPRSRSRLVDVGTGSGAIAIALACNLGAFGREEPIPGRITALDLSPAALAIAKENASRHGVATRIEFLKSDLLAALEPGLSAGRLFDAVVSNPPYVPQIDAPDLQPEVRDFEPHLALFAGNDGLEVYRRLIPQAWGALRPGGLLGMEFGFGQQPALAALLRDWHGVEFRDDLAGIPRVALARKP